MHWKNLLFFAALAVVVASAIALYDDFFTQTRCEFGFLARKHPFLGEKFMRCSNIDQHILSASGVTDEPSDIPGWNVYKPRSPDSPGSIRLMVGKDRDTAFFYPRVSGRDSSVILAEPTSAFLREWVVVRGEDAEWTPISRRYVVNLACVGRGDVGANEQTEIYIILNGPWAQLWHRDENVLF